MESVPAPAHCRAGRRRNQGNWFIFASDAFAVTGSGRWSGLRSGASQIGDILQCIEPEWRTEGNCKGREQESQHLAGCKHNPVTEAKRVKPFRAGPAERNGQ